MAEASGCAEVLIFTVLLARAVVAAKFKILHFNDYHSRVEPDNKDHGYCDYWAEQKGVRAGLHAGRG